MLIFLSATTAAVMCLDKFFGPPLSLFDMLLATGGGSGT